MGLSSSKTKTQSTSTAAPYTVAQPFVDSTLRASNDVFEANQPVLQGMAAKAQQAFNDLAPGVFQTSDYVAGAQGAAKNIFNGGFYGKNPGAQTYASVQAGQNNPATGALTALAAGSMSPGQYGGIGQNNPALAAYSRLLEGGGNAAVPGLSQFGSAGNNGTANSAAGYDDSVIAGRYLNSQPSARLYDSLINGDPAVNPYVDAIAEQATNAAQKAASQRFGSAGLGANLSSAYTGSVAKAVADANNQTRYTAYNDAANRRLAAAGQSDAAYSAERGRMEGASGRISSNYNASQDRALSALGQLSSASQAKTANALTAASGLGSTYMNMQQLGLQGQQARDAAFQADRAAQLSAAGTLGSQYLTGQGQQMAAAQAADSAHQSQIQQMLSALGLTGNLSAAQYAGIDPALSLLQTSAAIPYYGVNAQAGALNTLAGRYGTTTGTGTTTGGRSLLDGLGSAVSIAGDAKSLFSDARLKTNIVKVGELADGLGIYDFDYVWGGGRQRGVMAQEVARLRPWALGPSVDGYATVNYGAL